jgi:hypothetical protein
MIASPGWSQDQLEANRIRSIEIFRESRMQEPLEDYLDAFAQYERVLENFLAASGDLLQLDESALAILTDPHLLKAFRYLAGPPVSSDDLRVLAEAVLSPGRLRSDPAMTRRIVEVVRIGLDRKRFPWVAEGRGPTDVERQAAILASAALMATGHVGTARRSEGKAAQETMVETAFLAAGLTKVNVRDIATLSQAPSPGQFCGESMLGERKADFVLGLWDTRVMAIECKVSNSSLNSIKRLNNDAAVKAEFWLKHFGTAQMVPAAVLSGVYKLHHLMNAQDHGLALFWAHDLVQLVGWIERTKR